MEPTLCAGDWLLVDQAAYADRPPKVGQLVVARDPRVADRWLVKRVAAVTGDGSLRLTGDHPAHRHAAELHDVPAELIVGRPWLCYWPPARFGRIRSAAGPPAEDVDPA